METSYAAAAETIKCKQKAGRTITQAKYRVAEMQRTDNNIDLKNNQECSGREAMSKGKKHRLPVDTYPSHYVHHQSEDIWRVTITIKPWDSGTT